MLVKDDIAKIFESTKGTHTDIKCICDGHMVVRENSNNHNKFLGCSNYPKCVMTYSREELSIDVPDSTPLYYINRSLWKDMELDDYEFNEQDDDNIFGNGGIHCKDDM